MLGDDPGCILLGLLDPLEADRPRARRRFDQLPGATRLNGCHLIQRSMTPTLVVQRLLKRHRLGVTWQQQPLLQVPCSQLGRHGRAKHVVDAAETEWRVIVVIVVQLLAGSSTWW